MYGDDTPAPVKGDSEFAKLSLEVKKCIVEVVRENSSELIPKLKDCHQKEGDEIKCFKAIPELAKCFV